MADRIVAHPSPAHRALSSIERPELIRAASRIAGFDLGARPTFAAAANISGVRTRSLVFSQRRDSLTIFARDENYGHGRKLGTWSGPNRELVATCRKVLRAAKVPPAEIRRIKVAYERGTVAERLADGEVRVERPELLAKIARAERRAAGVPVWSSYAILGLTSEGAIGQLEIHWPDLSQAVLSESKVLVSLAKRGFRPLEVPGAEVESVEAGVIHSPAIGFFMDVVPVIRCIYRARDDRLGKKPVLYVDRHGELVSLPRDLMPAPPIEGGRVTSQSNVRSR
jgi:hypothetical protein